MTMRVVAAIFGDLREYMREELEAANRGVSRGIQKTGADLKARIKADTARALSPRIANVWKDRFYLNSGLDAASLVYAKAPQIMLSHTEGAVIRPRRRRNLAIPTDHVPRGPRGRRITPENWGRYAESRLGPLRYVPRPGGRALLVVDGLTFSQARQRFFRSRSQRAQRGEGVSTVVMYVLVPQVRLRRRISLRRHIRRAERSLVNNILRNYR